VPATRGLSIRTRAALAVALLVGFYALAAVIAGALLFIPYAELVYANRLDARIGLFCVIGAFLILKSVVPRAEKFTPPGPRLAPAEHPALFALIDDVARRTGQEKPAEVYLAGDVNAFVTETGGTMGFGGRRVMGIGLPLLEALTVPELRAVIAHEFGHFVGGDTRLGPWIYRTRAAIGRTLESLEGHSSILGKPFLWYGLGFLRVTHAVSRQQEFVAEAVAARVAGRDAAASALRRISGAAAAYGSFWASELAPALDRGYRPPLASGFGQFLRAPDVTSQVAAVVDAELQSGKSDPYDTHPSLRERLAALGARSGGAADEGAAPARTLLADVDALERALIAAIPVLEHKPLTPLSWDDAPSVVLPVGWRETVALHRAALAGLTPEQLPELSRTPGALAVRLGLAPDEAHVLDEHRGRSVAIVGSALSLALLERGSARLHAPPGEPVTFRIGDDVTVLPFGVPFELSDGTLSAEAWRARCEAAGIAGLDLGRVAPDESHVLDEHRGRTVAIVGSALSLALLERGSARLHAPPGEPVTFLPGDVAVLPFGVPFELADGTLSAEEWRARCEAAGIAGLDLGRVAPDAAPPKRRFH
jgi:Zn-dependent protease with chaperone function